MTNSRFEDLERRCQKIKRIRVAKIVLVCIFISLSVFGYFYISLKVNVDTNTIPEISLPELDIKPPVKEVKVELPIEAKTQIIEENTTIETQNYDTLMLAPIVKNSSKKAVPVEEKINLDPPGKLENMSDFSGKEERTPEETKKIINMSVKSLGNEEAFLKNYRSNNSFKTAFDVAQFYFDTKEYRKAITWSKEASKFDPTSDKPWIVYAKSKFYLGEKAESIRSLEVFVGYFSSKDAKDLLNFYKGQQ